MSVSYCRELSALPGHHNRLASNYFSANRIFCGDKRGVVVYIVFPFAQQSYAGNHLKPTGVARIASMTVADRSLHGARVRRLCRSPQFFAVLPTVRLNRTSPSIRKIICEPLRAQGLSARDASGKEDGHDCDNGEAEEKHQRDGLS
ncbi:MAG: hypothetical protein ACJ74W_04365 [Pyrinomonadaceae bacterium]